MLCKAFGVMPEPVYCTKIASRLVRTYTDKHGLKDLVRELLGQDLSKQQQSSDWGAPELAEAQVAYAAADVTHLHALKDRLDVMLAREGREELAAACFRFLPDRVRLDLAGFRRRRYFRAFLAGGPQPLSGFSTLPGSHSPAILRAIFARQGRSNHGLRSESGRRAKGYSLGHCLSRERGERNFRPVPAVISSGLIGRRYGTAGGCGCCASACPSASRPFY